LATLHQLKLSFLCLPAQESQSNSGRHIEGESAASFCHLVAALFPDMFCSFYLAKSHKFAKNSTTTKARGITSPDLESVVF